MSLLRRKKGDEKSVEPDSMPVATPINEATPRQQVCVCGKITRMTARPTAGQPALAILVSDATGTVSAVWTGRREIGGVTLGRRIAITGVPVIRGEQLEFTNPGYTLLSR
ncbi:MAG: OB-fold nucleic acid binding domain-containing protein [Ilumatobacteraceae bacterium]